MLILVVALASMFFNENAVRTALLTELGGLTGAQGGDALKAIIAGARREDEGLAALQGSWADPTDPGKLLQYAMAGLSMVIVTVIFAFIYKYLPATPIDWRDVVVGAILTAILFMGGKVVIGLYLGHGDFGNAYGAAGSIVALITWIYYSAQIFFFGALFTHEYAMTLGSRRHRS